MSWAILILCILVIIRLTISDSLKNIFMKAFVDKHETVSCKRRITETNGVGYTFCLLYSSTDVLTEGIFFKGFIAAVAKSTYTHCTAVWCDLRNEFILWSEMYEMIPPGLWLSLIPHLKKTKQNSLLCSQPPILLWILFNCHQTSEFHPVPLSAALPQKTKRPWVLLFPASHLAV